MGCLATWSLAAPDAASGFPERSPENRVEALDWLTAGPGPDLATGRLRELAASGRPMDEPRARLALARLMRVPVLAAERSWSPEPGLTIHYTLASTFDAVDDTDLDGDGRPDLLDAVHRGVSQARDQLVERLRFSAPGPLDVYLVGLGGGHRGYTVAAGRDGGFRLLLEAAPRGGVEDARRTAVQQYAHAVAAQIGGKMEAGWSEALAHWTLLEVEGRPGVDTLELMDLRVRRLGDGLIHPDLALTAGNVLWLAFIDEIHGPAAVRLTLEQLARLGSVPQALNEAVRTSTDQDLASLFREFQLWTLLTGPFADREHFSFASSIEPPRFASTHPGLPALSVQSDPAIAPWGAAQVLIRPERRDGGLRLRFEGEFGADWDADLLLVGRDRALRRVGVEIAEGRGDVAVPLGGVEEVLLLVRQVGAIDDESRSYTYAAHGDRTYPYELVAMDAVAGAEGEGVAINWETGSEHGLAGFNVLRSRREGGPHTVVNPIRMPSLGDEGSPTSYFFIDQSAESGVTYYYRIQGITREGLTSESDAIVVRPASRRP